VAGQRPTARHENATTASGGSMQATLAG
jgi:hypothetical protein